MLMVRECSEWDIERIGHCSVQAGGKRAGSSHRCPSDELLSPLSVFIDRISEEFKKVDVSSLSLEEGEIFSD